MERLANIKTNEIENLELLANLLQVANYIMSVDDAKNTDVLKELDIQNNNYLSKIIEQNEIIIKQNEELLKRE